MGVWIWDEDRARSRGRRRRARVWFMERGRRVRMRRLRWCAMAMACAMGLLCPAAPSAGIAAFRAVAADGASDAGSARGCVAAVDWPLRSVRVVKAFDGPAQPWLSGHRGVDLSAKEGDALLAPADGAVSFAGSVAGKQVVSLRHGDLTLTFEPAVTEAGVGAWVRRGEAFAAVGERSDHCDGACLHWGVRRGGDYLDPASMTAKRRIALKAMEDAP